MKPDKNGGWVDLDEENRRRNKKEKIDERESFIENGEKYTPYALSKTYRIPLWLKALIAKWWFPGMVFYFVALGLGRVLNQDALAIALGLVWGLVTDLFLNHYFRDFSSPNHDYTRFILCGRKPSFLTIPVNLVLGVVLSFLAAGLFDAFVLLLRSFGASVDPDDLMLTAGPILYATFFMAFDFLFVGIRNLVETLIRKRKKRSEGSESKPDGDENLK